ncbi:oxidase [Streptomyces chryseus]|nr:oxidase [Streptomyces chryseus]
MRVARMRMRKPVGSEGRQERGGRAGAGAVVVVGAGPAGVAAAVCAADQGVRVVLVDSAVRAGGQFYRQPDARWGARRPQVLHHGWRTWQRLTARLDAHLADGQVTHLAERHVWFVERAGGDGFVVHALGGSGQDRPETVRGDAVLLATGAYEKVLPFPGWTLPGVVTAGGAQAMLKGGLVLPPGRTVVVAGTGPLLMPVAAGLAAAGARVGALIESAGPGRLAWGAARLAGHPAKLAEGARYAAALVWRGVPVRTGHAVVAAHGSDRLEAVTVAALDAEGRVRAGTGRRIACDALAVGHGLLPHTDLAGALGCRIEETAYGGWGVAVDGEQRTDVPGVWAAGEASGVGGAELALAEGEIAGRSIAARLRGREPDRRGCAAAAGTRAGLRAFARVIDGVYGPPAHWAERVGDDTVVCRCEEVPASAVRSAVAELGATDLRSVKLLTRAGMGWCQGRVCAPGVAGVAGCAWSPASRVLAQPVPLAVLAREEGAAS